MNFSPLGAVFVGYGLGIMQFAEGPSKVLFAIPMLVGMFFIGIDLFRDEREERKKRKIRDVKKIIEDLRKDKQAMKDLNKWIKEMEGR